MPKAPQKKYLAKCCGLWPSAQKRANIYHQITKLQLSIPPASPIFYVCYAAPKSGKQPESSRVKDFEDPPDLQCLQNVAGFPRRASYQRRAARHWWVWGSCSKSPWPAVAVASSIIITMDFVHACSKPEPNVQFVFQPFRCGLSHGNTPPGFHSHSSMVFQHGVPGVGPLPGPGSFNKLLCIQL